MKKYIYNNPGINTNMRSVLGFLMLKYVYKLSQHLSDDCMNECWEICVIMIGIIK